MKSTWNDRLGHRGRLADLLLVTADGQLYRFKCKDIPHVCRAVKIHHERRGKWSNTTWEISHAETTTLVPMRQDWGLGLFWPQSSWDQGFAWLAEKAPQISRAQFEEFIRTEFASTAEGWDAARQADDEFGAPVQGG